MVFVPEESHEGLKHNIALQQARRHRDRDHLKGGGPGAAPAFEYADGESYAWEPQSGHADPSGTAMAYAARSREMGAEIILESPVTDVEIADGRVVAVHTATERYEAPIVVIATGPWSGRFMARLGYDLPLEATRHEVFLIRRPMDRLPFHPGGGDMANLTYFRPEAPTSRLWATAMPRMSPTRRLQPDHPRRPPRRRLAPSSPPNPGHSGR